MIGKATTPSYAAACKDFGRRLRRLRQTAGLGQSQFGRLLGVSRNTALRWENGQQMPHTYYLLRICALVGCTPDTLLGYEPQRGG